MYDIHCHILPGVDDGVKNLQDSLEMCKIAWEDGVNTIIATPHYIDKESEIDPLHLLDKVDSLNREIKGKSFGLNILPGMEIFIAPDLAKLYEDGKIITLNMKRYMLIEFPLYNSLPTYLFDMIFSLELKEVTPVIAHPERCNVIIENPGILYRFIEKGCIIQVNAGSIEGKFGTTVQKTADTLLKHNMVHVIASDNHSSSSRMSRLKNSYDIVSKKYGVKLAEDLFINNPLKIINGEEIDVPDPVKIKKKKFLLF